MSKKITENIIKKLIEEVLQEQRLNEKYGKYQGNNTWDRKQSIGLPRNNAHPTDAQLKDLVNLDTSPVNTLDDDDLKLAADNNGSTNPNEYATAKKWFDRSSKAPSGFADLDAYVSSLSKGGGGGGGGGGSTLYFYADSSKKNLKSGFHTKKDSAKGHMGAIAAEMKKIAATPGITNAELTNMLAEVTSIFAGNLGTGNLKKAFDKIQTALGGLPPAGAAPDALKIQLQDLATALQTAETQDITAPVIQDVGSDSSRFPPGLITPLNDLFAGKTDFDSRLKELERVSNLLVNSALAQIQGAYPAGNERQFLRDVIITDYFSTIFREVDDRSLGYYFESLGALLGGGAVQGASNESGDFTVAVGPGAQDFDGSSKAVQGGSSQALSGFIPGRPVLYLVAKKTSTSTDDRVSIVVEAFTVQLDSLPAYDGNDNTAAVEKLISVFPATNTIGQEIKVKPKQISNVQNNKHGGAVNIPAGSYTYKLSFGSNVKGNSYTLHFAKKSGSKIENLKQLLNSKMIGTTDIAIAYQEMEKYFDELKTSQAAIKDYIGSDDLSKGSLALTSMTRADSSLESILTKTGKTITGTGASRKVSEGKKITSDYLKKIISESFKK